MTLSPREQRNKQDFVQRSSLYRQFLAEREEILKHKWIESEKAGYDIGFERALLDWIQNHRDSWRAAQRSPVSDGVGASAGSSSAAGPRRSAVNE